MCKNYNFMCAQRTYHRAARGKRETKEMPIRISCGNSCIIENQWRHAKGMAKNHGENCHWSSPTPSPEAPKTFQNRGGGTHESPDATKSVQKACKRCPRDVQVLPKTGQKRPKCGQDAPKTGQGGTQTPPKTSPASSKTHIGHDRHRQPLSKGCQNDFARFVALRAWLAKCVPTH